MPFILRIYLPCGPASSALKKEVFESIDQAAEEAKKLPSGTEWEIVEGESSENLESLHQRW